MCLHFFNLHLLKATWFVLRFFIHIHRFDLRGQKGPGLESQAQLTFLPPNLSFLLQLDNYSFMYENTYSFKYVFLDVSVSSGMHYMNEDENDFKSLYGSGQSIKLQQELGHLKFSPLSFLYSIYIPCQCFT